MDASKLCYMAEQIAKNFMALGEDEAIAATADHIDKFWDPRMKQQVLAADHSGLTPVAAAALERL